MPRPVRFHEGESNFGTGFRDYWRGGKDGDGSRGGESGIRNGGFPQWWKRGRSGGGQEVRVVTGRGENW